MSSQEMKTNTPLQKTVEVVKNVQKIVSKTSKNAMLFPLIAVFVVALLIVVVALAVSNKKEEKKQPRKAVNTLKSVPIATKSEIKQEESKKQEQLVKEAEKNTVDKEDKYNKSEDPNGAFPSMEAAEDDPDAALAGAYTFENLQDSMLSSARQARETIKTRGAWSQFGQRGTPENWEAQMKELKKEIESSGQTFDQFVENSWAPIPEQMASFWKQTEADKATAEVKTEDITIGQKLSKAAASEAPSITRDATQEVPTSDHSIALSNMKEILSARKRAKSLKIKLPALTSEQKNSLTFWSKFEEKIVSGTAKAILAL
jgi:hypothetical protein